MAKAGDACDLALQLLGADYERLPAQGRDECSVPDPVRLKRLSPEIALPGEPVLQCDTARAMALWADRMLKPAAAMMPGAPRLTAIRTGPGHVCRDRVGTGKDDPKPSEHSTGSAIDVTAFEFDNGATIAIEPREGDMQTAYQAAARAGACLFFTTVLGPGANAAHDDHLHLDMAERNGGWRLCQ
nr:extensin family protein [Paracoccus sp. C2R09]